MQEKEFRTSTRGEILKGFREAENTKLPNPLQVSVCSVREQGGRGAGGQGGRGGRGAGGAGGQGGRGSGLVPGGDNEKILFKT